MRPEDGRAELGALDERRVVRFNGKPAIALGVIEQATTRPSTWHRRCSNPADIRSILPEMKSASPTTSTVFIAESIKNVYHAIGKAIVLVVLIIFLFLRSIRVTLMPMVTIPVSIIGASQ